MHTPRATWALSVCTKECDDNSWTSDNTGVRFISAVSRAVFNGWG
ncbi:MAG TPA: hypothetical protein VK689_19230 [Armatimonadota bacterium]|nr:hypothetical protein [Armatimonadota bacterium]